MDRCYICAQKVGPETLRFHGAPCLRRSRTLERLGITAGAERDLIWAAMTAAAEIRGPTNGFADPCGVSQARILLAEAALRYAAQFPMTMRLARGEDASLTSAAL
jgi:hypothetical protein